MTPPKGRLPKDKIRHPRTVAEGAGRAIRERLPLKEGQLGPDLIEEISEVLNRHAHHESDDNELGPYLEEDDWSLRHESEHDDDRKVYRFRKSFRQWLDRQTPERLAVIDELVDERREREVIRRYFRGLRHFAIAAFGSGVVAVHYFADQLSWFMEKLPVLREFWALITKSGKP